jgi:hypothetical protein
LPLTHFKLLKGFSQESCFLADQTRRVVMKTLMAVGTISRYIFLTPSNEGRPEPFTSMVYLQTNLASIAPCDKNSHISDIVVTQRGSYRIQNHHDSISSMAMFNSRK